MGDMLSGINAQVQMSKGNFAPTPVSVGDLFVGAILPSAVLVGLYMLYMAGKAALRFQTAFGRLRQDFDFGLRFD